MIHTVAAAILIIMALLCVYVTYDDDNSDRTLK